MHSGGEVLNGRYRLLQRAGAGGMATVYKGQDLLLGRLVAVKLLHESLTGDEAFLQRFQQEAHKAANLSHPNIVTVHDIGQDNRRYYIIMEYVDGWTLKEIIRQHVRSTGRPLSLERALNLSIQICAGIGYAHRAGLVHCDVKSQNVMVARDESVKVTDFGIARALSEASIIHGDLVWGTPQYFSPEQAAGEKATPASDVYSIGVILFELLTGRLPFEADSHTAMAVRHLRDAPPLVSELNPRVPDQIDQIVSKVLIKEPSGRYRTADQLGRVLASYRTSTMDETGPLVVVPGAVQTIEEMETAPHPVPQNAVASPQTSLDQSLSSIPDIVVPMPDVESTTDWIAIALAIIAFISLLGLIPLWYLVFVRFTG